MPPASLPNSWNKNAALKCIQKKRDGNRLIPNLHGLNQIGDLFLTSSLKATRQDKWLPRSAFCTINIIRLLSQEQRLCLLQIKELKTIISIRQSSPKLSKNHPIQRCGFRFWPMIQRKNYQSQWLSLKAFWYRVRLDLPKWCIYLSRWWAHWYAGYSA